MKVFLHDHVSPLPQVGASDEGGADQMSSGCQGGLLILGPYCKEYCTMSDMHFWYHHQICIHSLYCCSDWMMRFMQRLCLEPDPESMYYTDDVLPLQEAF